MIAFGRGTVATVCMIEAEWRDWAREVPQNPEMGFLGFCRRGFRPRGKS